MELSISGITVKFPFTPYPQQETLMDALIKGAQLKRHCLIESPTGTGKTLCLLTSTLAWREAYCTWKKAIKTPGIREDVEKLKPLHLAAFGQGTPFLPDRDINSPNPVIYYASRTHSQLSQCVQEIRNTQYQPVTAVLGSRDQMCVNEKVASLPSGAKGSVCRSMTKNRTCSAYVGSENPTTLFEAKQSVMDIEELVAFGKAKVACPFYLSSQMQQDAHIIFLPYQYLIDSQTRMSQKLRTDNAIIIFDEGHNVESACSEAYSFDLSLKEIEESCIELDHVYKLANNQKQQPGVEEEESVEPRDVAELKVCLQKLAARLKLEALSKGERNSKKPGEYIFDLLKLCGIDETVVIPKYTRLLEGCIKLLASSGKKPPQGRYRLAIVQSSLRILFEGAVAEDGTLLKYFKVHIQEKETSQSGKSEQFNQIFSKDRILSFWCFSAAVAMQDLSRNGCRSIILASGTLSPLNSFAKELGLEFPLRIENTHVIDYSQIYVGANAIGPGGTKLLSSYEYRDSPTYVHELGMSIVNICRIVPDGILVFFTSYYMLDKYLEMWKRKDSPQAKSIWDLIGEVKVPFSEVKGKQDFSDTISGYEKAIADKKGAIFFAICRGKASEGLDFSDSKARAVLICGIPFPAMKDPRVLLKKEMINAGSSFSSKGDDWYKQQAYRALNQAIGRVIRHRKDFGAIILLDQRFMDQRTKEHLPVWIKPYVQNVAGFGILLQDLRKFFKFHKEGGKNRALLKMKAPVKIEYEDPLNTMQGKGKVARTDPLAVRDFSSNESKLKDVLSTSNAFKPASAVYAFNNCIQINPVAITAVGSSSKPFDLSDPLAIRTAAPAPPVVKRANFKPALENFSTAISGMAGGRDEEVEQISSSAETTAAVKRPADEHENEEGEKEPKKKGPSKDRAASVFLKSLKKTLLPEDYEVFKNRLRSYNNGRYTQEQLIVKTSCLLFPANEPSETREARVSREGGEGSLIRFQLFNQFGLFVSKKHDAIYQSLLTRHRPK